ncbi:hypothetical protein AGMMS4957_16180 [Bacteroidia bacterium]|nr:hypothetical protein AGMMS4957_16180 [Bacteroidia bacterium]
MKKQEHSLVSLLDRMVGDENRQLAKKLDDRTHRLFEKLVHRMQPDTFLHIRPAHAILQITPSGLPTSPTLSVKKDTCFQVQTLPKELQKQGITSMQFASVADCQLVNTDLEGTVKNLPVYLDLSTLGTDFALLECLQAIRWTVGDRSLKAHPGFPILPNAELTPTDAAILGLYHHCFQTIEQIDIQDIPNLTMTLPTCFTEKIRFFINAFPVVNQPHGEYPVECANHLSAHTVLTASRVPELNKSEALLLTPSGDGRHFQDTDTLTAIWQFHLTAHGRINTRNDLLNFCKIELGAYARHFDIASAVQTSPKNNEGIIQIIEIHIAMRPECANQIAQSNTLSHFFTRLKQHSPDNFRYALRVNFN